MGGSIEPDIVGAIEPIGADERNDGPIVGLEPVNLDVVGGTPEPPKRGRGRPRKDNAGSGGSGSETRNRKTEKKGALDVSGVEAILFSAHMMLAGITKNAELSLDKQESRMLAEAIDKVNRHYELTASAKAVDWANLVMVAAMIYGPRIAKIVSDNKRA